MKINLRGVSYNVEIHGEGEPLLLLHGFTGSAQNWKPFLSGFTSRYKMIIVDLIGHGKTESPTRVERYTMVEVVKDLVQLLVELKETTVHILGYSMGGRVAISFAAQFPERVRSLLLESSSPGLKEEEQRSERIKKDEAIAKVIEEKGIEHFVDFWEEIPMWESQQSLPQSVKNKMREQRLCNVQRGLANSLKGMGTGVQPPYWNQLRAFSFPVLLIVGELDKKFLSIANAMITELPDANLQIVGGVGHAIHVEKPKVFGKIVMNHLQAMSST